MALARIVCRFLLALSCLLSGVASAAPFIASVDQRNGLPFVGIGGTSVVSSDYVFWRKDWAWTDLAAQFKVFAPFRYGVTAKNQGLNFDLNARIGKASDRELTFSFELDAHSTTPEAIGGGISFKLNLGFAAQLGEPELLPGNRG